MKYRTMEVPPRVAKLPQYKGLYVPYTTMWNGDVPNFKAVDNEKVWEVKRDCKCSVCGEPLDYWIAFMVTEEDVETKHVFDNPNHEECLRYSFNVCPFLYYSKANYSDINKLNANPNDPFTYVPNKLNMDKLEREPKLGIYITNNYKNVIYKNKFRVCKVGKAKRLEWIEGK